MGVWIVRYLKIDFDPEIQKTIAQKNMLEIRREKGKGGGMTPYFLGGTYTDPFLAFPPQPGHEGNSP